MLAKFGIADPKKLSDWVLVRDPENKKSPCTGNSTSEIPYYMVKIYHKKFGLVDNAKRHIVYAQLISGTRKVQTDASGTNYFTLPLIVDWIEIDAQEEIYNPDLPNVSDKFLLPDVVYRSNRMFSIHFILPHRPAVDYHKSPYS